MRLIQKIGIAAGGLVFAGVLTYGEVVLDWRTRALAATNRFRADGFCRVPDGGLRSAADRSDMKRKYGEQVSVSVPVTGAPEDETGMAEVSLDGKVAWRRIRSGDWAASPGCSSVSPENSQPIRFPF